MTADRPVTVACDESGAEGEKLIGGNTEVFGHAGVALSPEEASECLRRLRELIRSPATEYKATHLLRPKNRSALEWFLGPDGPVHGRAHAWLADKAFFLLVRFTESLVRATRSLPGAAVPEETAHELAAGLYREGPDAYGRQRWGLLLRLLNEWLRSPSLRELRPSSDAVRAALQAAGPPVTRDVPGPVAAVQDLLRLHRLPLEALVPPDASQRPAEFPVLDPLGPAIEWAFARWSGAGGALTVVHDQQTTLTDARISRFEQVCGGTLRLVPSASDARVQVADFLAGVARKLATDELLGHGDPALTELLRPYIDLRSVWGDDISWSQLAPVASAQS